MTCQFFSSFSTSIFKIFVENRCTAYTKLVNNNINLIILKSEDFVIARILIQSDKNKEKATKLCYGSYFVKKLHKPNSPELNFIAYDVYLLSPSLKPCEPIDTTDIRYLNQSHAPLTN